MTDKRFTGGRWTVSVSGLDLIFKVLCLIAKIMIWNTTDRSRVDEFEEELNELKRN